MFAQESKYRNLLIIGISLLYVLVNAFFLYYHGIIYFAFFPFAILVGIIALYSYDKLFYLIAFLTPLSLSLSYIIPDISFNLSILTEPLLILLLLILIFKFLLYHKIEVTIIKHPITISVLLYLFWILITSVTSTMPVISFKFFLSKIWLVIPVFFIGITLFKKTTNIKTFIWAYSIALMIIVIYSTVRLGLASSLTRNASHFVSKPFYNDHTAYGTIVALFTPVLWGLTFNAKYKPVYKIISGFFALAFTIGVILSYSRASWLGILLALGVFTIIKLGIKFKYILTFALITIAFLSAFWFQIIDQLEKNNQDSSSNISHHITSITNISTDASNVERLNRWYCAIEMFKEKPLVGWGPGTYQFQYAPFQKKRMRTIISTNSGNIGNAHSEYLGALAEQGIFGTLAFLLLAITILSTGFKIHKFASDKRIKSLALSISLGFITYFFHALLNNFLDSDKIAIPFFGFAAIIVALDIYHNSNSNTAITTDKNSEQ